MAGELIDFFNTPEEEGASEASNNFTSEKPTNILPLPAPESGEASLKDEENDVDFFEKGGNDGKNNEGSDSDDYTNQFQELIDNGFIDPDDIPEGIDLSEGSKTTAEDTLKALLHNLPKTSNKLVNYGQNTLMSSLPKEMQQAILMANNNGDPLSHLRLLLETNDIKTLSPDNETHQEKIVREFYKTTDLTTDEIEEKIEDLKDTNLLQKEASKLKPKLDARAEKIAQEKLESQVAIKEQKEKYFNAASDRIQNSLVKGLENIKFSKEEATEFLGNIMKEQEFDYGTHKSTKTNIEFLIDFHKYSSEGDPSKIIKAYMILDPQGRYEQKLMDQYKSKMADKFVTEHVSNSGNKFKIPNKSVQTSQSSQKSQGKFKFKN